MYEEGLSGESLYLKRREGRNRSVVQTVTRSLICSERTFLFINYYTHVEVLVTVGRECNRCRNSRWRQAMVGFDFRLVKRSGRGRYEICINSNLGGDERERKGARRRALSLESRAVYIQTEMLYRIEWEHRSQLPVQIFVVRWTLHSSIFPLRT